MADTISTSELARACGRTPQWVRDQGRAGYFEPAGRGRWKVASVYQGLVERADAIAKAGEKSAAASRATDARTREIEQRIAIRERELIPVEDAVMALDKVVGVVSGELSGLPARISRDLTIRKKAETEVHVARRKISEALAEMSGAARTGVGLDETGGGADP